MMRYLFAVLALHACTTLAYPTSFGMMVKRTPQQSGTYTCQDGGARKAALEKAGANTNDLSIQQLEVGCDGDGNSYKDGDGKSGASSNCGTYKNNWANIAKSCCGLNSQLCGDFNQGGCDLLNNDDAMATQCQHLQQCDQGSDWDRTQRGGSSGTAQQGQEYANAVNSIQGTGVNGQPAGSACQPAGKPPSQPSGQPPTQPSGQPPTQPSGQPPTQPSGQPPTQPSGGTDIYGSDVCGYGGGPFRGCKTVGEMCAHIKTNGQPLPPECGGSNSNGQPASNNGQPASGNGQTASNGDQKQPTNSLESTPAQPAQPAAAQPSGGDTSAQAKPAESGEPAPAITKPKSFKATQPQKQEAQPKAANPNTQGVTQPAANGGGGGGTINQAGFYNLAPIKS